MGYQLTPITVPRLTRLCSIAPHSIDDVWRYGSQNQGGVAPIAAAVWPSANLIIYTPVPVKQMVMVRKLWYGAGATGTGNVDIGIYNRAGTRLVNSGSTAKIAASDEQIFDITDLALKPDLYYLALQASNGTDTYNRFAPTAPIAAAHGVRAEAAGSFGCPATAPRTGRHTLAFVPIRGLLTEATLT